MAVAVGVTLVFLRELRSEILCFLVCLYHQIIYYTCQILHTYIFIFFIFSWTLSFLFSFFSLFFYSSLREIGQLGRGVALHSSRINTLLFDRRGIRLFSGDGAGVVNVWRCNGDPADVASYRVIKRIEHPDVNGLPINSLSVSDATNTLLIHAKQSILRLVELKYYRSPHPGFNGAHCGYEPVQSCLSADGRYVLSGSKTGGAHVWKSATGVPVDPAPIRGHRFGTSSLNKFFEN